MPCSQCDGIEQQFDDSAVRKKLDSFRRRGPDRTTKLLIEDLRRAIAATGNDAVTLLDVGAGIGAIHHVLLDGPISRVTHVDASSAHLAAARQEVDRRHHTDNVSFVHGDFVALADSIPAADVVTLDRVICCYHDMTHLVRGSANKATRLYGAVYPRDATWMRFALAAVNVVQRVRRSAFRVFLHPPVSIDAELRAAGLERVSLRRTLGWEIIVYKRSIAM
jgi:magnesium-protoporphyrin O-methyltransferase